MAQAASSVAPQPGAGKPKHAEVMYVPKETFIKTPAFRVVKGLTNILARESDQEEFVRFASRVESLLRAMFVKKFSRILNLYTYFDPIGGSKALEHDGYTTEQQIVAAELEFLAGLAEMLSKSSFRMLTEQQFKMATSSQFLLQMPVQVDLKKIDSSLLERYFLQNKDLRSSLPDFSSHYVIATRGVGMATESGLFVMEKINIVIKDIFYNTIGRILPKTQEDRAKVLAKVKVALRRGRVGARPADGAAGVSPAKGAPAVGAAPAPLAASEESSDNIDYERVRLENLPLATREWFKPTTIKEPTFENVVVIYRPGLPADKQKKSKSKKKLTPEQEEKEKKAEKERLLHRPIIIRQFGQIPMADLEIVFPEKKIPSLTPMDWVTLLVTAVMGVVAIFAAFQQKVENIAVLQAAGVALVTYIGRIFAGFQKAQQQYQKALSDIVYSRQLDSGKGTLLNIFQQVVDQELKETLIAFYILLTEGKANVEELDTKCEDLLADEFKEVIDFDVKDACDKLLRLGIISKDADGRYSAVSMKRANEILGATTEEVVSEVIGIK